jgi:hypothetical protein
MVISAGKSSKHFFFEKKKQKLLQTWPRSIRKGHDRTIKSFLLLFFKKEDLASLLRRHRISDAWLPREGRSSRAVSHQESQYDGGESCRRQGHQTHAKTAGGIACHAPQ